MVRAVPEGIGSWGGNPQGGGNGHGHVYDRTSRASSPHKGARDTLDLVTPTNRTRCERATKREMMSEPDTSDNSQGTSRDLLADQVPAYAGGLLMRVIQLKNALSNHS